MEKVMIIGANGTTGRIVSKMLAHSKKYQAIAMIRKVEQTEFFNKLGVETCIGDLEQDFSNCFNCIDKVIFVAGSGSKTGPEKTTSVDQEGAKRAVNYAEKNKLKKFVMLSSIGTYQPEKAGDLEHYIRAKKEADEYLRKSELNYSIVQPGRLTNEKASGKVKTAKQLSDYGSISRADVAHILIECLTDDAANRKSFEVIEGNDAIKNAVSNIYSTTKAL
ncbi:MAG: SDR family oxidoreductase, partial [Psychroflexus maritimus]